ncbi:MAG: preprotein translocase subunit SecY [Actinomycetota bacterium]|jgi:preprotein translocase subunit SecY|nr:preprotein translocase subunit SecY [Actinomycetota bacterium]MDQ1567228.1 preprotein translocase subunit SecY [Actinomycetota bacterium]
MLSRLRNMFRVADLRNKILFTLIVIAIYRLGSHLPLPYVDFSAIQALKDRAAQGGALEFLDLFSGGALTNVAVFALGIMPYITSSIIMQLLAVVIPKLEEWQQQGQVGQKKITQWTRYLTVALALMQSTGIVFALHQGGGSFLGSSNALNGIDLIPHFGAARVLLIVTTLTAGTAMIMWLGELITQRGIGNGMSILIFSSVVSRLPAQGSAIWATGNYFQFATVILMGIGMIVGIIFVEQGQRRIPVQFAKRVVGRRMYGGQSTYIPLKVNQSGVIPIIFASSVLYFPALITGVLPWTGVQTWVQNNIVDQRSAFHIAAYALLIIFFAYFYTAIAFNPQQQADIIRKQGGFIPGIRPGPPTERYLQQVLNRITLPGSIFLMVIAIIPLLVFAAWNIRQFPFGGTAILITVGVALETMKQIDSQLMMRNYEGFLR